MGFYLAWATQTVDRSLADDLSKVFSTASNVGTVRVSFAGDAESGSLSGAANQKLTSDLRLQRLPLADRSRMGICGARRHPDCFLQR